jgi:hypothetical protein
VRGMIVLLFLSCVVFASFFLVSVERDGIFHLQVWWVMCMDRKSMAKHECCPESLFGRSRIMVIVHYVH